MPPAAASSGDAPIAALARRIDETGAPAAHPFDLLDGQVLPAPLAPIAAAAGIAASAARSDRKRVFAGTGVNRPAEPVRLPPLWPGSCGCIGVVPVVA